MTPKDLIRESYIEGAEGFEKAVQGLNTEQLDWRDRNGAITIGSQILHIIGFENLVVAALRGADINLLSRDQQWREKFQAGFPRELGVEQPSQFHISHYMSLIGEQQDATLTFIDGLAEGWDAKDTKFYEDSYEFQEAYLRPHNNAVLLNYIPVHYRYHRGQISHIKWMMWGEDQADTLDT